MYFNVSFFRIATGKTKNYASAYSKHSMTFHILFISSCVQTFWLVSFLFTIELGFNVMKETEYFVSL